MNKKLWIVGIGFVLILAFSFWFLVGKRSLDASSVPAGANLSKNTTSSIISSQNQSRVLPVDGGRKTEEFVKNFLEEKNRIGQVDPNPKESGQRLKDLAKSLSAEEAEWLKNKALDSGQEGDDRFLSAYLLAHAGTSAAFPALEDIALSLVPVTREERFRDLEVQVRASAMEGISKYYENPRAKKVLDEAANRQNDAFLRDRANRSAYSWENRSDVEKQDQNALEKLLYKK